MFTDIEGSTRLLDDSPEDYRALLARHNQVVRAALQAHGGFEVRTEGDSFFAAFSSAPAALQAAIDIQRGISDLRPLKVRIGLHTGEAQSDGGDYHGQLTVHHAARIAAAGNGDQIIVSSATRALVDGQMTDLGDHRLKDITSPVRLFRVSHPDIPDDHRRPRSEATTIKLPTTISSFIGREHEREQIARALTEHRLVTLTGAGGSGKTRLAIEAARAHTTGTDAIAFVDLSAVVGNDGIGRALTDALELQPDEEPVAAAIEHLGSKRALLVLDNCEQVLDGAIATTQRLLDGCLNLRIMATSREPLGVPGESIMRVPSLTLPDADTTEALNGSEAARLFADRARERDATFTVDAGNAPAVAQICTRLDGIPLAIELAAARIGVLSPADIAKRLDDRFGLLAAGSARIERQRTLRATIDWSHNTLDEPERTLLRRLSVFAGPFSLEGAEYVSEVPGAIDVLGSLVDKSLVTADWVDGRRTFRLLETIRQYAAEKLADAEDPVPLRDRHLAWYIEFAEHARIGLQGPDIKRWLDDAERELDNVRLALGWARERDDAVSAACILWGLERFWWIRTYLPEAHDYVEPLLDHPSIDGALRVRLLHTMCTIARWGGVGAERLDDYVEQAVEGARALNDDALLALSLFHSAYRGMGGNEPERAKTADDAVAHARRTDDPVLLGRCLMAAGLYWSYTDDTIARERSAEALSLADQTGDIHTAMIARNHIARIAPTTDEMVRGFDEVLEAGRAIDDRWLVPWVTLWRGSVLPPREYAIELERSIELLSKVGQRPHVANARLNLSQMYALLGDLDAAEGALEPVLTDTSAPWNRHRARALKAAILARRSRYDDAVALLEETLAAAPPDTGTEVMLRRVRAACNMFRGRYDEARDEFNRLLELDMVTRGGALNDLALVEHLLGNHEAARARLAESLDHLGSWTEFYDYAETGARILVDEHPAEAAALIGFARAERARLSVPILPVEERDRIEGVVARAAARVDADAELARGAAMSNDDVVALIRAALTRH